MQDHHNWFLLISYKHKIKHKIKSSRIKSHPIIISSLKIMKLTTFILPNNKKTKFKSKGIGRTEKFMV